jgi:hypothetical protein
MKTIYISSTFQDLEEHRKAVISGLRKMQYNVKAMEDYVASDNRPVDVCVADVASCDIYVGIFAWRYGYVPKKDNPDGYSITEIEYRAARKEGKPALVFLVQPDAQWSPAFMDSVTGENEKGTRIEHLRHDLEEEQMFSRFSTPATLVMEVQAAAHLAETKAPFQVLSSEIGRTVGGFNAQCLTMMSSARPEIITNIRRAIGDGSKANLIKVNLGAGQAWWSTRLHLLCALCAYSTDVRRILFESEGWRFVGLCAPAQAQRALARAFPEVETAYRESMVPPEKSTGDLAQEVGAIVDNFSSAMDRLGGEEKVKRWVEPEVIAQWPGVRESVFDVSPGVGPSSLDEILTRPGPFTVLLKNGVVQQVVDNAALATRLAQSK